MENEIITKRGLVIVLVVVTVVIFVGLVWLITTYRPWGLVNFQKPSATARLPMARNCTYPVSYWKVHPELFPSKIVIGGIVYSEGELQALLSDDTEDPAQMMKAQLATAFLNSLLGADQRAIESALFKAYGWLMQHPTSSQVTEEELYEGRQLYYELEAYNQGLSGVEPCGALFAIPRTSTATRTQTAMTGMPASQTVTPTASKTPTPTKVKVTATFTYVAPTRTRVPNTEPPIEPIKTPTATKTHIPDTATFTPPPPPTPTFTLPPLPSATYTLPPP